MDPEDLREVTSAYQKCVAETVRRFGGFVAADMGDGVLAYFGYPEAHEDDAERAVRAGPNLAARLQSIAEPNSVVVAVSPTIACCWDASDSNKSATRKAPENSLATCLN